MHVPYVFQIELYNNNDNNCIQKTMAIHGLHYYCMDNIIKTQETMI